MDQAILIDHQGNRLVISNPDDLLNELRLMCEQEPQISILEIQNFGILTFGISRFHSFIEYMTENREPPYLYANSKNQGASEIFVEFDSGGTITPVSITQCLPTDIVFQILFDSFTHKKLPEYINWYEE